MRGTSAFLKYTASAPSRSPVKVDRTCPTLKRYLLRTWHAFRFRASGECPAQSWGGATRVQRLRVVSGTFSIDLSPRKCPCHCRCQGAVGLIDTLSKVAVASVGGLLLAQSSLLTARPM